MCAITKFILTYFFVCKITPLLDATTPLQSRLKVGWCNSIVMRGSRGAGGRAAVLESPRPLKNHKNIGFLSNTGQDGARRCRTRISKGDFGTLKNG